MGLRTVIDTFADPPQASADRLRQPVWQRSGEPKLANGNVAQPAFLDIARPAAFGPGCVKTQAPF